MAVIRTMEKRTMPRPRCVVTRTEWSLSTMTIAPRVIWPITAADAIMVAIFIGFGACLDLRVKAMVVITRRPVVAATDR